jgi:transposase
MAPYSRGAGQTGDLYATHRAGGALSTGREPPPARSGQKARLPVASGSASEPSVIGSTGEWLLTRGHDAHIEVAFDPYAPYVLRRWEEGERNGTQIWREIAAQGYPGSQRMLYRFLETLKTQEMGTAAVVQRLPHYSSTAAVSLFMRRPNTLDEIQREQLEAFRLADPSLDTTYRLAQDFLVMMRKLEGERLDAWLAQAHESELPELQSFAQGVERDKSAVQAGLTLQINNGQVEGQVTRIKLLKRMMYGKAGFALLRQRVLHRIERPRRIWHTRCIVLPRTSEPPSDRSGF